LLSVDDLLRERLFPGRIELPRRWNMYYRGEIATRALPRNTRHRLRYAF